MLRKRLLLILKPFDLFPSPERSPALFQSTNLEKTAQVLKFLCDRALVHRSTVKYCQNILNKKAIDWRAVFRNDLSQPIRDVDLVIAIGGDGTLLHTTHFMDDSIPILGVNSDPTIPEDVEIPNKEIDATRSTGYLCAATTSNFEQILDDILMNRIKHSEVTRMAISVNSKLVPTSALNDILLAHPCPAMVSRFSFRIKRDGESCWSSSIIHCRSSGLRISTSAGSTAAMLSAGGLVMPIMSKGLQYLVREPISPNSAPHSMMHMHGFFKFDEKMELTWNCSEGLLYIDGSHVVHSIQHGDKVEFSSKSPVLNLYLPRHLSK